MLKREKFSSGAMWEDIAGYSRAIKIGNRILFSGTTSIEGEEVIGENDFYTQTMGILRKIEKILEQAGARMEDIVRTRIYVTDISKWEEVSKAHRECFGNIKPVTSMVQVSALIDSRMLVEIEAEAIVEN